MPGAGGAAGSVIPDVIDWAVVFPDGPSPIDLATDDQQRVGQKCCSCQIIFPMDGSMEFKKITSHSCRCQDCATLYKRIQRMTKSTGLDTSKLTADERVNLMREAHGEMGPDLQKRLEETIRVSNIRRTCSKLTVGGPFEDPADVRLRFKDKPEQLANIEKYAQRLYCPVRRIHLVQVPTYTQDNTTEDITEEERTRKVVGEQDIKKQKPTKDDTGNSDKKINAATKKKVQVEVDKLLAAVNTLKSQKCQATAQDMEGSVPPHVMKSVDKNIAALEAAIEAGKGLKDADGATKGDATAYIDDATKKADAAIALGGQMGSLIQWALDAKTQESTVG